MAKKEKDTNSVSEQETIKQERVVVSADEENNPQDSTRLEEQIKQLAEDQDALEVSDAKQHKTINTNTIMVTVMAALVVIALVLAGVAIGLVASSQSNQQNAVTTEQQSDEGAQGDSDEAQATEADHEHQWTTNWVIVETPAKTHTVEHDAVIESQTTYHTVCNICKAECDTADAVAAHKAETGHNRGFTANVPITNDVVVTPAWTETVVDTPASEELVPNGEICTVCKETRNTTSE